MSKGWKKFSTLSYIGVNIIKNRSHSNTSLYLRILSNSKIYYTEKSDSLRSSVYHYFYFCLSIYLSIYISIYLSDYFYYPCINCYLPPPPSLSSPRQCRHSLYLSRGVKIYSLSDSLNLMSYTGGGGSIHHGSLADTKFRLPDRNIFRSFFNDYNFFSFHVKNFKKIIMM